MKPNRNNSKLRYFTRSLLTVSIASALYAGGVNAAEKTAAESDIEVITVNGIKGSIQKSLNTKRFADQIKDAISAEDIGKLPDSNIAEALQRITGIQIERSFGEGSGVAVRGMTQNRIEMNGQTLMGSNAEGRGINFEDLAPGAFKSMEVVKSPTANMTEGALGATINLITRKALDMDGMVFNAKVQTEYTEDIKEYSPKASMFFANKWETGLGDMGMTLALNYSDTTQSNDSHITHWRPYTDKFALVGEERSTAGVTIFAPKGIKSHEFNRTQKRQGLMAGFQWQPTDALEIYIDSNYNKFDIDAASSLFEHQTHNKIVSDAVLSENNTLLSGTFTDSGLGNNGWQQRANRETYGYTLGANYEQDDWILKASASRSVGKKHQNNAFMSLWGDFRQSKLNFDNTIADLPVVESFYSAEDGGAMVDYTDITAYKYGVFTIQENFHSNEANEVKLDLEYALDLGHLTGIDTGIRYAERTAVLAKHKLKNKNLRQKKVEDFPPELASPSNNYLEDFTGGFRDFVSPDLTNFWGDPDTWLGLWDGEGSLEDIPELKSSSFDITEKTSALYVKANFEGHLGKLPYSANVGARYIQTKTESSAYLNDNNEFIWQTRNGDYSDVLGSANLQLALNENTVLRFAAANVMTRPPLAKLSSSVQLANSELTSKGGNPDLEPFRATQYDISLEWYGDGIDFMSAAVFIKDIEAFIVDKNTEQWFYREGELLKFDHNSPVNVNGSNKIKGAEFAVSKSFGFINEALDGLGLSLNYTYSDSDDTNRHLVAETPLPLEKLSKHSANLVAFYEQDGFSTRLAYNWRSEFLYKTNGEVNYPEFEKSRGQLDFSAGYRLNKTIRFSFNAINLNDSYNERYLESEERNSYLASAGRRFNLGVNVKF